MTWHFSWYDVGRFLLTIPPNALSSPFFPLFSYPFSLRSRLWGLSPPHRRPVRRSGFTSYVGTRGGVRWMRGPCACPPRESRRQPGQAQGPRPSAPPLLVPTPNPTVAS